MKLLNKRAFRVVALILLGNDITNCMEMKVEEFNEPNAQSKYFHKKMLDEEEKLNEYQSNIKTVADVTFEKMEELFHILIKISDYCNLRYLYFNNPPSQGVENCNNGMQCMVFSDYMSQYSDNPGATEQLFLSLNQEYQQLKITYSLDKIASYRTPIIPTDNKDITLNYIKISLCSEFTLRSFAWAWFFDDGKYRIDCMNKIRNFAQWLITGNTTLEFLVNLPNVISTLFDIILYYTRVYRELLACSDNNINDTKTKPYSNLFAYSSIVSDKVCSSNEAIASDKTIIRRIINSGFKSKCDTNDIKNPKTIACLKLEQEHLFEFAISLVNTIWLEFVQHRDILKLFSATRYHLPMHITNDEQVLQRYLDLVAYRLYIVCQKICNFLPDICNYESGSEARINQKIEEFKSSLKKSYIAKKAIEVYSNQLKVFLKAKNSQTLKEHNNLSDEQNSSQNTSNTTASTDTSQKQQPSIKIQQNVNKITTTNYQNKNNIFQIKRQRRYVKVNYMKKDNKGNAIK